MNKYICDGSTITFPAAAALAAGSLVALSQTVVCTIETSLAAGDPVVGLAVGVVLAPKKTADVIAIGDKLYLASGEITTNQGAAGAVYAGKAWAAAGNGSVTCELNLNA